MNLGEIPQRTFEYLIGMNGVPDYLGMGAVGLTAAVGEFLAGTEKKRRLVDAYERALWWKRADTVSHAVRSSYIAELRAAA